MSILITGGAGYIGSHTMRALRDAGHDVVALDNLRYGAPEAVLGEPLVVGDISDAELVRSICREHAVTGIVHFAAFKNVGESMQSPGIYWQNNVANTSALVEAAAAEGVRSIVFSSSCSVYGTPAIVPVAENSPIQPESVYAETKATTERLLRWYGVTHGVQSVSLRYFNAAGASLDNEIGEDWSMSQNLIPVVMKATLGKRHAIDVFGDDYDTPDGTCIRDYVHVEDLADAHVKAIEYLAAGGESTALNVGTGTGSSVFEVINATQRISGLDVPHRIVARRVGDPVTSYADPRRVRTVLGWAPKHGLDTVVETAWRWHSTHVDGYPSRSASNV